MNHLLACLAFLFIFSCKPSVPNYNEEVEIIKDFSTLQNRLDSDTSKIWVVNFWATSCPPCIKEMPHFIALQEKYDHDELKVLLISLDQAKSHDKRVIPFIKKHNITPEVMHLVDENYSAWTDKIDTSWYGALPATLILKGSKRKYKFGMYENMAELEEAVNFVSN